MHPSHFSFFNCCYCFLSIPISSFRLSTNRFQIAQDGYGVPHVFGQTDVVYGLAWAHAENNFETIQQTLLEGKAMVGRVFGEKGAAVDFFVHLLETRSIAEVRYLRDFSPEFRKLVDAYLAGINDFALEHPERVLLQEAFPVTSTAMISAYILSLAQMSGADKAVQHGPIIESVNVYGASNQPGNIHYDDQMKLFVEQN